MRLHLFYSALLIILGNLFVLPNAFAKVYVNSVCQMKGGSPNSPLIGEGNLNQRFPLASVSKIVTTLWAIDKYGIDFRYKTYLHISPNPGGGVDLHIEGSRNPIFGRNLSYFLISELNRHSISQITNLSFDENFLFAWLAEEKPLVAGVTPRYSSLADQGEAVRRAIMSSLATPIDLTMYGSLRNQARRAQVQLQPRPKISIRRAEFLLSKNYVPQKNTKTLLLESAPLSTILKRMNSQSNNYVADNLFWNLGGTRDFNEYVRTHLQSSTQEIVFVNGSGNNEGNVHNPIYNEASCQLMIKIIYSLNKKLAARGYKLHDVLPVASVDRESTLRNWVGNARDALTGKTGTVNKAKTLAGVLSTNQGDIYFAVLMHMDMDQNSSESGVANQIIKNKVQAMFNKNRGPKRLFYTELGVLPFDRSSYLKSVNGFLTTY